MGNSTLKLPIQLSFDDYNLLVEVFSVYNCATSYHTFNPDPDRVSSLRSRLLPACLNEVIDNASCD